jgi:hypothetical protein
MLLLPARTRIMPLAAARHNPVEVHGQTPIGGSGHDRSGTFFSYTRKSQCVRMTRIKLVRTTADIVDLG